MNEQGQFHESSPVSRSRRRRWWAAARQTPLAIGGLAAILTLASFAGCRRTLAERAYPVTTGGVASRGQELIVRYHCGVCHTIPGVREARGYQAPPLLFFSRRSYIAGKVPNTPDNLVRWILSPQTIDTGTAMPTLGLSEQQARDVAAYLYTID